MEKKLLGCRGGFRCGRLFRDCLFRGGLLSLPLSFPELIGLRRSVFFAILLTFRLVLPCRAARFDKAELLPMRS